MKSRLSWANALTALRLVLVPVVAAAMVYEWWLTAFVGFFVAVASDMLDGAVAKATATIKPIVNKRAVAVAATIGSMNSSVRK